MCVLFCLCGTLLATVCCSLSLLLMLLFTTTRTYRKVQLCVCWLYRIYRIKSTLRFIHHIQTLTFILCVYGCVCVFKIYDRNKRDFAFSFSLSPVLFSKVRLMRFIVRFLEIAMPVGARRRRRKEEGRDTFGDGIFNNLSSHSN